MIIMKQELRKTGLSRRNQMSEVEVRNLSAKIIEEIKKQLPIDKYDVLGFYMPLGNEVDLRPLMAELIAKGKTIVIPKVLDKNTMEFYPLQDMDDYYIGKFNVREPKSNKKMPKTKIDIIFVPGIYFSADKYRLGFGAGYYDRYLKDYPNLKVGICYGFQYIPEFPSDIHDVPMDLIITENPSHPYHDGD